VVKYVDLCGKSGRGGGVLAKGRFFGKFEYTIDSKGRLAVPVTFRKKLGPDEDSFVFVPGRFQTIEVHPYQEWNDYEDRVLRHQPEHTEEAQRFSILLYSQAGEATLDVQGRILLPKHLREWAGIDNEVIITGAGRFFLIWEPERYRRFVADSMPRYQQDRDEATRQGWERRRQIGSSAGDDISCAGPGE